MNRDSQQDKRRAPGDTLDPLAIWQAVNDPNVRWNDEPGRQMLAQQFMLAPHDAYLADAFLLSMRAQQAKFMASGDPFWPNYPPAGTFARAVPGTIPLLAMPNQEVLPLPVHDLCRNACFVGTTGGGKTTFARSMIGGVLQKHPNALIVAFDRKGGELVDCAYLLECGVPVHVLRWFELQIALLQPIGGMRQAAFIAVVVQLFASVLNLFASRRLMSEMLALLFDRARPPGEWPRFSRWIELIDSLRATPASRLGQYREASLAALTSIFNELGEQLDYASSNFFDALYAQSGCIVISTAGLSVEAESLLACLFINHAFQSRADVDPDTLRPVFFVLDDALPVLRGGANEAEGGVNPVANWAFMGRSRRMGMICAAQNYSLISPAFRNNASTVLCFSSWGQDAWELSRDLHLTKEQAARLPQLQPGEVVGIARSVWPMAVYGRFPEVK